MYYRYEAIVTYMGFTVAQAFADNLPAEPDAMISGPEPAVAKVENVTIYAPGDESARLAAEYLPFAALRGETPPYEKTHWGDSCYLICVLSVEIDKNRNKLDPNYVRSSVEALNEEAQIKAGRFSARQLINGRENEYAPPMAQYIYAVEVKARDRSGLEGYRFPTVLIAAESDVRALTAAAELPFDDMANLGAGWKLEEATLQDRTPIPIVSESVRAIEAMTPDRKAREKIFTAAQLLGEELPPIDNIPPWAAGERAAPFLALLRSRFGAGPMDHAADDVIYALSPHEALRHVLLDLGGVAGADPETIVEAVDAIIYPKGRPSDQARRPSILREIASGRLADLTVSAPNTDLNMTAEAATAGPFKGLGIDDVIEVDFTMLFEGMTIEEAGALASAAMAGKHVRLMIEDGDRPFDAQGEQEGGSAWLSAPDRFKNPAPYGTADVPGHVKTIAADDDRDIGAVTSRILFDAKTLAEQMEEIRARLPDVTEKALRDMAAKMAIAAGAVPVGDPPVAEEE